MIRAGRVRPVRGRALLLVGALVALLVPAVAGPVHGQSLRRLAGPERAATAAAIALDGWDRADAVVLADGGDPVGALVGGHLAARLDVPLLLSAPSAVPDVTAEAVRSLGAGSAVVVGVAAVPEGLAATPVAGDDPAGLAAAAVQAVPGEGDLPVVVASQATAADALAAANLAPARLLLTDPQALSPATAEALVDLDPAEVVVVGGEAAVAPGVVTSIEDRGPVVRRVAGGDRFSTAVAAARAGAGPVALASGERFADAVAVVPWAARRGAAVLLTPQRELTAATIGWVRGRAPADLVVLGGTAAVGNFAERQVLAAAAGAPDPGFEGAVRVLSSAEREAMTGPAWRPGCPVGLDDLRAVDLAHFDMGGNVVDDGVLVVHVDHADDVLQVARSLFDARFPLAQVRPIEVFGGDDDASMAANNSSGFNCRAVAGTQTWSEHAYGRAVDLNPVQNPYVRGEVVEPPAGEGFLDRADVRPGMVVRPGPVVSAFEAIGWGWGADFSTSDDYQHFSATGR